MTIHTHRHAPRGGFTMVELLLVMGIIAILAALTLGVSSSLMKQNKVRATRVTIEKAHTVLRQYHSQAGSWPDAIPTAQTVAELLGNGEWETLALRMRAANRAVASILTRSDEFSIEGSGSGGGGVLVRDPEEPDTFYVVDHWHEGKIPEDSDGHFSAYAFTGRNDEGDLVDYRPQFLNFVKQGHNKPGLDVWSNGPNGKNETLPSYVSGNPQDYGDDIVNWTRR